TYALAQDYQRAGLFDRAEKLLSELAAGGTYRIAALKDLVGLYELERDWEKAIAIHKELARIGKPEQPSAIAHYHCELAEAARASGDTAAAREHLRAARSDLKRFPRAALVRADVALDLKEPDAAVRLLVKVPLVSPQLAGEVLPRLVRALKAAGREDELAAHVAALASDGREVADAMAYAAILTGTLDAPPLLELARGFLGRDSGIAEIIAALHPGEAPLSDEALRRLAAAIRRQAQRSARFRCGECGFSSSGFFWQCPGCKSWDSLKPLSPAELAAPPGGRRR
ncbi:MAG: tetratricopeptide repeat protein, partial [Proteobacteria bacterium]|nr:tetratricopeptide repeat protein [Pseudomonadota bacterium]